jgi:type I restriction enzyme S subunit
LLANSSKKDSSNLDKSKYKLVCPDDIVYNKMRAWQGAIGVSRYRGIVSPAYIVVRLRRAGNPNYFHYLLRTPLFAKEAERWSYGITPDMWSLRPEHFKLIYSCVPRHEEQTQIARFLDWKTAQINKFIRNKRRLIELLKEQKQNVINQAVTRGLDPNVKLKPSGVEWIGDIPEHWDARRLKTIAKVVLGKMLKTSPSKDDQLKPYLRSANIQWFEANLSDVASMWFSPSEMEQYRISKNDILVSEGGEVGRACIWQDELEECYIQNSVHKVTAGAEVLPLFLLYQFSAFGSKGAFKAVVNRVSIAHLTREKLVAVFFCKPPIEEQKTILAHIQAKTTEIDQAIIRAQREIELMREYRTRLISDVVTGQVDVRGIEVPEVAEDELLALEEDTADVVIDDEGDMDETD